MQLLEGRLSRRQEARIQTRWYDSTAHTLNPSTSSQTYTCHYSYKPVSKQKSEEELKDKNQLLEAVNKQLHQKLTETQVRDPPDLCHKLRWAMLVDF